MINIKIEKRDRSGIERSGLPTPDTGDYGFVSDDGEAFMAYLTTDTDKEILKWEKRHYLFKFVSES